MEIAGACDRAGCQKVLVVGQRTRIKLSTMDIFELGEHIAQLKLQVAMVETHDASADDVTFLENVASNRGGPIQFFDNERDAKCWLEVD